MPGIRLKSISKMFGKVTAIRDLNLEVNDKEFLVLVGPSGCGKSTVLRLIAGLDSPDRGDIYIGDHSVNHLIPRERDVAMVFQSYALYPHLSVYDNIAFPLKMKKHHKQEIAARVNSVAETLGIGDLLKRKPRELSGGQRQRVALGRAIVRKPRVFLMDEPLSNLDAKLRTEMRVEIKKLQNKLGITTIYVTHDQTEAMTMGDRVAILKDGILQQVGSPYRIYQKPKNRFVAEFIGSPPMNFLTGTVKERAQELYLDLHDFTLPIPSGVLKRARNYIGEEVTLGIRPSALFYSREGTDGHQRESFKARVDMIEPLGGETIVHFILGKNTAIALFPGEYEVKPGEKIDLYVDLSKMYLFDKNKGRTLC